MQNFFQRTFPISETDYSLQTGNAKSRQISLNYKKKQFSRGAIIFIGALLFILATGFNHITPAQTPVFVKNVPIHGIVRSSPNSPTVAHVAVAVATDSYVGSIVASRRQLVLVSDANGHFEAVLPCYRDVADQFIPSYLYSGQVIGTEGGGNSASGVADCANFAELISTVYADAAARGDEQNMPARREAGQCDERQYVSRADRL